MGIRTTKLIMSNDEPVKSAPVHVGMEFGTPASKMNAMFEYAEANNKKVEHGNFTTHHGNDDSFYITNEVYSVDNYSVTQQTTHYTDERVGVMCMYKDGKNFYYGNQEKFNAIYSYDEKLYATDENGNGVVDEGEIHKLNDLF